MCIEIRLFYIHQFYFSTDLQIKLLLKLSDSQKIDNKFIRF